MKQQRKSQQRVIFYDIFLHYSNKNQELFTSLAWRNPLSHADSTGGTSSFLIGCIGTPGI